MDLKNKSRRWVVSVAIMVCLVAPMLVACGGKAPERPKEDPQLQQQRKEKRDG